MPLGVPYSPTTWVTFVADFAAIELLRLLGAPWREVHVTLYSPLGDLLCHTVDALPYEPSRRLNVAIPGHL